MRYAVLQETFFFGEHSDAVKNFDFEQKQVLFALFQEMEAASELVDLKDFIGVEESIEIIGEMAQDFPERQVRAIVNSSKRASNIALMAAQQKLIKGIQLADKPI